MSSIHLHPCSVKFAQAYVALEHRHLKRIQGGLFAVAVRDGEKVVGVGIAGNPARVWQDTGRVYITRVATDGFANACSMIYGALCRAAKALGYREAWTYTLGDEPGTSLRAAGFEYRGLTDGGEHDRPSRRRGPAVNAQPKHRWVRTLAPCKHSWNAFTLCCNWCGVSDSTNTKES